MSLSYAELDAMRAIPRIARSLDRIVELMEANASAPAPAPSLLSEERNYYVFEVAEPQYQLIARFRTLGEAEACIVGLEHQDPVGVRAGRYVIDGPVDDED